MSSAVEKVEKAEKEEKSNAPVREEQQVVNVTGQEDDESSVVSLDGSLHSTIDAEAEEARQEAKRKRRQKLASNITTLVFIGLDGARTESKLSVKLQTYSELQREICRLRPGTREMYMIQDEKGKRIGSEGFVPRTKIFVRTLLVNQTPSMALLKPLAFNWEATDYHEIRLKREADERAEKEVAEGISFLN